MEIIQQHHQKRMAELVAFLEGAFVFKYGADQFVMQVA